MRTEAEAELNRKVTVTVRGRKRQVSYQTLLLKRLIADAVQGDARAREQLLRLMAPIEASPEARAIDPIGAAKDTEILARFRAQIIEELKETES